MVKLLTSTAVGTSAIDVVVNTEDQVCVISTEITREGGALAGANNGNLAVLRLNLQVMATDKKFTVEIKYSTDSIELVSLKIVKQPSSDDVLPTALSVDATVTDIDGIVRDKRELSCGCALPQRSARSLGPLQCLHAAPLGTQANIPTGDIDGLHHATLTPVLPVVEPCQGINDDRGEQDGTPCAAPGVEEGRSAQEIGRACAKRVADAAQSAGTERLFKRKAADGERTSSPSPDRDDGDAHHSTDVGETGSASELENPDAQDPQLQVCVHVYTSTAPGTILTIPVRHNDCWHDLKIRLCKQLDPELPPASLELVWRGEWKNRNDEILHDPLVEWMAYDSDPGDLYAIDTSSSESNRWFEDNDQGGLTIRHSTEDGRSIEAVVRARTTLRTIHYIVTNVWDIPLEQFRLLFDGEVWHPSKTLREVGIKRFGDQVDVVVNQVGC